MTNRFKYIHSSSRFNRTPASLLSALRKYITYGAVLITLTETERPLRKAVFKQLHHFDYVTGHVNNKDDGSILFDTRVFKLLHQEQYQLSTSTFRLGRRQTPISYACIAVLLHKESNSTIVVAVYHTPSGIEGDLFHHHITDRVHTWLVNVPSLRRRVNHLRREWKANGAIISCDWNGNFFKAWFRAVVKTMFPSWTLNWSKDMPRTGTHGKRLIDGTLLRGLWKIIRTNLLPDDASSDHRPYFVDLELD